MASYWITPPVLSNICGQFIWRLSTYFMDRSWKSWYKNRCVLPSWYLFYHSPRLTLSLIPFNVDVWRNSMKNVYRDGWLRWECRNPLSQGIKWRLLQIPHLKLWYARVQNIWPRLHLWKSISELSTKDLFCDNCVRANFYVKFIIQACVFPFKVELEKCREVERGRN